VRGGEPSSSWIEICGSDVTVVGMAGGFGVKLDFVMRILLGGGVDGGIITGARADDAGGTDERRYSYGESSPDSPCRALTGGGVGCTMGEDTES